MSNDLDFELIDDSVDEQDNSTIETEEDTNTSDDKSENSEEQNTPSAKSKKSNWKKMSKALKAKDKEIAELKAKLSWKSEDDADDDFDDLDWDDFDRNEFRFFLLENSEAKEYQKEIEWVLENYPWISFDDALALAKAKKPQESKSTNDFETKSVNTKVRKKISDLTEEEALKLDWATYLKWARSKGRVK